MLYRRILAPVDGSPTSNAGLREAARIARDQRAKLRIVHLVDEKMLYGFGDGTVDVTPVLASMKRAGMRILSKAVKLASGRGLKPEWELSENVTERVADVLVRYAKQWRADLIVMGTHGRRGVNRMLLGSDAEIVVRNSPVPVLLVRAERGR